VPTPGLVVVADDERDIVELVAFVLTRAGFEVLKADDGTRALELVRERLPVLCVLDGVMPGRLGFEVLREIRDDPRTAPVAVVILTASIEEERELRRHGIAPDAFIGKPFEVEALLAVVNRLLAHPGDAGPL
jgi:DNA-binding response OmpR family regulator